MSAGDDAAHRIEGSEAITTVIDGLQYLAPKFEQAVTASLIECKTLGIDAAVYESYRTYALAKAYYAKGRTIKPPAFPVTNAIDNMHSWHGFGLAVDVIHRKLRWDAPSSWWPAMAAVFKRNGCAWGGDWQSYKDRPHLQWGTLIGAHASPDDVDRTTIRAGGLIPVWTRHGAI